MVSKVEAHRHTIDRACFNSWMKYLFLIGLATVLFGGQPANAQPHIYTIGGKSLPI